MKLSDIKALSGMLGAFLPEEQTKQIDAVLKVVEVIKQVLPKDMPIEPILDLLKRTHVENTTYKGKKCVAILIEKPTGETA